MPFFLRFPSATGEHLYGIRPAPSHPLAAQRLPGAEDGGDGPSLRHRLAPRWQADPEVRVLVISTVTDCAGLTLTAANHLFVLDPVLVRALSPPSPPYFRHCT
jgi:hypothetical protein